MPISETIQYIIVFGVTVIFTVFALTIEKNRLFLKIAAGTCWFIMAVIQFILGDITSALTLVLPTLWFAFGFILFFLTIRDWKGEKKDHIWKFD